MTPPRTPQVDYEQELKIVRKFLNRNNINDLMLAMAPWGVQPHVVRVVGYKGDIVSGLNVAPSVDFSRDIDTDGYFDSTHKDRLTVPEGLGGNYFIHTEVRWLKPNPQVEFDLADRDAGRFYSHLRLNNEQGPVESSRSTNSAVPFASGTTQICMAEIQLTAGDYVQLLVNQTVCPKLQVNAWMTMRMVGP